MGRALFEGILDMRTLKQLNVWLERLPDVAFTSPVIVERGMISISSLRFCIVGGPESWYTGKTKWNGIIIPASFHLPKKGGKIGLQFLWQRDVMGET